MDINLQGRTAQIGSVFIRASATISAQFKPALAAYDKFWLSQGKTSDQSCSTAAQQSFENTCWRRKISMSRWAASVLAFGRIIPWGWSAQRPDDVNRAAGALRSRK